MNDIGALVLNEKDNVGTALRDLQENEDLKYERLGEIFPFRVYEKIPYGFKFSLDNIDLNDPIIKYGQIIGRATKRIPPGYCVHIHNVESMRGRGDWNE
jgi:altronate dehydratase small subunit